MIFASKVTEFGITRYYMERSVGIKITPIILIVVAGATWAALVQTPRYVAIDDSGSPGSPVNRARELFQGEEFWREQIKTIDRQLADLAGELEDNRKQPQLLAADLAASRRDDYALYRDNPQLRPTPAELKAQSLRDRAKLIEFREEVRVQNEFIRGESERLTRIRVLAAKQVILHTE